MAGREADGIRHSLVVGSLIAITALIGAGVAAAGFVVAHGNAVASGRFISESSGITWWTETTLGTGTNPSLLPANVGLTSGSPVVLVSNSATYRLGSAGAGHLAVVFGFQEASNAVANKEFEISVTVAIGGSPPSASFKGYIRTQAAGSTGAFFYYFFYDSGPTTTTSIIITSVTQTSSACSPSCP